MLAVDGYHTCSKCYTNPCTSVHARARRVRLSINQSSSGFGGRSPSLYEFRSVCDAERFMCVLARVGAVPEVMPRHLLSTPVASAPVLEPVLRATALWGTHWPTQPVNIFVGESSADDFNICCP